MGLFLVYGTMSFAIVQRRRSLGILRALGATRAQLLRIILLEATGLALVGGVLGLAAGLALGHLLVGLVSRTINDLYYVVAVNSVTLPRVNRWWRWAPHWRWHGLLQPRPPWRPPTVLPN